MPVIFYVCGSVFSFSLIWFFVCIPHIHLFAFCSFLCFFIFSKSRDLSFSNLLSFFFSFDAESSRIYFRRLSFCSCFRKGQTLTTNHTEWFFTLIPTNLSAFKMLFKQQKPYELFLWRFRIHANTNKDEAFSCFIWGQSDIPLYISWPINACRLINSSANIGIYSCACAQFTPAVWSDNFNQHAKMDSWNLYTIVFRIAKMVYNF